MGDPLTKVQGIIDWESFRPVLDEAFLKEAKGPGGRPAFDRVMMFKVVMLQHWYGIADEQTEYTINDRLSFQRFLELKLTDKIVDAKTIWLFKKNLKRTGADAILFGLFIKQMEAEGVITKTGSLVDASFVDVPKQRNSRIENEEIKKGELPESWNGTDKLDKNKLSQKDLDARWAKKNGETHYGYKDLFRRLPIRHTI